ncbi:cytochrome P450 [Crepidotus variabilis]|uniref:Cytochrome P450 n=1 Tax=Crepidotus variabilis TaxID=179855 RepID=A0A9P6JJ39_9AGAR|nr:cytochrome P450 [Crepidotus variabilis]
MFLVLVDLLVVSGVAYLFYRFRNRSSLPLPPGPKRLPLFGNALSIPNTREWLAYHKWSKELGTDILYLEMMGQSIIILDSHKAASDLLEKRSTIYSSRPPFTFLNELVGTTYQTATMKYGETWRLHRRLSHAFFGPNTPLNYKPPSVRATLHLMNRLLDNPKDIKTELHYMAGDSIMSMCYGLDVRTKDGTTYLDAVQTGIQAFTEAAIPGQFFVDMLTFLKYVPEWMPGAGFQNRAREWRDATNDMLTLPFAASKQNMALNTCPPCFTCQTLQAKEEKQGGLDEEEVRNVMGAMFVGGSDTTAAALSSCILGLLSRPDVLQRAREELDRVIKPGSLPDFEDEPFLPYITAIAKEALRWREVTAFGMPHYNEVEDVYKGYRIPAGTIVMPNLWTLLHDEDEFPDPFSFKPERFMKGDEFNHGIKDPESVCWGFGRRICPGRHMAFSAIWITIASLIYVFDIEKEVDEHGSIIEPNPRYNSGLILTPEAFPCRITPRSDDFAKLVRASLGQ